MSELPAGWATAPIGDLCSLKNGRAFKPTEWKTEGVPIVRIQNLNNPAAPHNYYQGEVDERNRLKGGELLFAWSGTPGTSFGAHIWHGQSAVLNQHIFRVDFNEGALDKRFFRFAINEKLNDLISVAQGGVGLRHVTKGVFESTPILVPPRAEQTRIADHLDTLLARVEACRERLDRVPAILKRFRQSVLAAATSGELTRDWRKERSGTLDTESWVSTKLVDLCVASRAITYGVIKLGEEAPSGVPCLRTSNVRWLRIDTEGMKRIAPALCAEFGRTVLQGGEVLVNVRGTLGGVAVVDSTMRGWNISREVAVVPLDQKRVNPHFLAFWIGSDDRQRWLSKVEKGVAYTGINIEDLRTLPVSVPPLEEQLEIVGRVQAFLEAADELERRHAKIAGVTAPLTPSLLAKAFRGELVPQDPNDEPAAALLARIAAQRQTASVASGRGSGRRGGAHAHAD